MKRGVLTAWVVAAILLSGGLTVFAQPDSAVFINDDYITGAVESMDRGIIAFSTDYSDDDFMIEWEKIKELYTTTTFIVALSNGDEHIATLRTTTPGRIQVIPEDGDPFEVSIDEVVNLNPLGEGFLDRLSANIDVGYSRTKAQNISQLNVRSMIGYETERWATDISYNTMQSNQDGVEPTKISDATWNFRYNLPAKLFALVTVNLLSDTEQLLDFRANSQGGLGAYIIRSNRAYWMAKTGINRNFERYTDPANDRESWEGFIGTEMNIYDLGDLSFLTTAILYPGITERGRWRSDLSFDIKYDFPMDFYATMGFSLNWDNMPVAGAEATNYVFLAGFGWEW
ncbi:MAG: DUF481 domain-containing protein [Bacteroidota bacterium]